MFKNSEELRNILKDEDALETNKFLNTNRSFNPLLILLLITTGLMGYFAYQNYISVKKDGSIDKKVHKEALNKIVIYETENEELKIQLEKLKKETENIKTLINLSENIKTLKKKKPEIKIEEKIVTINKVNKKNFNAIFNSKTTKTLKCYDYEHGDFNPTNTCKKNLKKFVKQHSKALRFELVSVISKKDKAFFKNYKNKTSELLLNGLSLKRLHELTWYLKKSLGERTIVTSNNFYIESNRTNSGILIKAYF